MNDFHQDGSLRSVADINLIPFGNAYIISHNPPQFSCQHGEKKRCLYDNWYLIDHMIWINHQYFGIPIIPRTLLFSISHEMLARRFVLYRNLFPSRIFSTSLKTRSINGFFAASNYAIVGASTKPGSLGNIICENYKKTFKGETFYINPKGWNPNVL